MKLSKKRLFKIKNMRHQTKKIYRKKKRKHYRNKPRRSARKNRFNLAKNTVKKYHKKQIGGTDKNVNDEFKRIEKELKTLSRNTSLDKQKKQLDEHERKLETLKYDDEYPIRDWDEQFNKNFIKIKLLIKKKTLRIIDIDVDSNFRMLNTVENKNKFTKIKDYETELKELGRAFTEKEESLIKKTPKILEIYNKYKEDLKKTKDQLGVKDLQRQKQLHVQRQRKITPKKPLPNRVRDAKPRTTARPHRNRVGAVDRRRRGVVSKPPVWPRGPPTTQGPRQQTSNNRKAKPIPPGQKTIKTKNPHRNQKMGSARAEKLKQPGHKSVQSPRKNTMEGLEMSNLSSQSARSKGHKSVHSPRKNTTEGLEMSNLSSEQHSHNDPESKENDVDNKRIIFDGFVNYYKNLLTHYNKLRTYYDDQTNNNLLEFQRAINDTFEDIPSLKYHVENNNTLKHKNPQQNIDYLKYKTALILKKIQKMSGAFCKEFITGEENIELKECPDKTLIGTVKRFKELNHTLHERIVENSKKNSNSISNSLMGGGEPSKLRSMTKKDIESYKKDITDITDIREKKNLPLTENDRMLLKEFETLWLQYRDKTSTNPLGYDYFSKSGERLQNGGEPNKQKVTILGTLLDEINNELKDLENEKRTVNDASTLQRIDSKITDLNNKITIYDKIDAHSINFKGMNCAVGKDSIHIAPNGDVYPSACLLNYRKARMGNIYRQDIIKPTSSIRCPFVACYCGPDQRIEKWA